MTGPKPDPDQPASRPTPLGIYDQPQKTSISGIEVIALVLSGLWLLGALVFFLVVPVGEQGGVDGLRFSDHDAGHHSCRLP